MEMSQVFLRLSKLGFAFLKQSLTLASASMIRCYIAVPQIPMDGFMNWEKHTQRNYRP